MKIAMTQCLPRLPRLRCFYCNRRPATQRVSFDDGGVPLRICLCPACVNLAVANEMHWDFLNLRQGSQAPAPEAL